MSATASVAVCQLLPADARRALVDAANVPESDKRIRVLESAISSIRFKYPQFFKKETPL